jgi:hypothetical protein
MSCDEKENTFDKAEDGECNLWRGSGEENEDKGRINVGLLADKRQNKYFVYREQEKKNSNFSCRKYDVGRGRKNGVFVSVTNCIFLLVMF